MAGVKDVTVRAGQDIRIRVPYSGVPQPTVKWFNGENEIDNPRTTCKVRNTTLALGYTKYLLPQTLSNIL